MTDDEMLQMLAEMQTEYTGELQLFKSGIVQKIRRRFEALRKENERLKPAMELYKIAERHVKDNTQ